MTLEVNRLFPKQKVSPQQQPNLERKQKSEMKSSACVQDVMTIEAEKEEEQQRQHPQTTKETTVAVPAELNEESTRPDQTSPSPQHKQREEGNKDEDNSYTKPSYEEKGKQKEGALSADRDRSVTEAAEAEQPRRHPLPESKPTTGATTTTTTTTMEVIRPWMMLDGSVNDRFLADVRRKLYNIIMTNPGIYQARTPPPQGPVCEHVVLGAPHIKYSNMTG